jgi:hypothetical protein
MPMGHFLAVSAFRDQSVEAVASSTISYASMYGLACKTMGPGKADERVDLIIFAPQNRWTVVLWPQYFNVHDMELCRFLSEELSSLVSTVHVYHDDYWANATFDRGNTLSLFASVPGYFTESEGDAQRLKAKWSGNVSAVSMAVSVPEETISPHLVHLDPQRPNQPGKAFPDDRFELWNFWVFTDFWRRLGIAYPADVGDYRERLRLPKDFGRKLPCGDQFEL